MLLAKFIVWLVLVALLLSGCTPPGYKAVRVPEPESPPPVPTASGAAPAGGPSFAHQIAVAGGLSPLLPDIPPQRYLEEIELKYDSDKTKRYTEKLRHPGASLLGVVGTGLTLGLAPGLGSALTAGSLARLAAGPIVLTAANANRKVSKWERQLMLARILPFVPHSEAATAKEAAARVRQVLEQAAQGLDLGKSVLLGVPLPTLEEPPPVIAKALGTDQQVWTWAKGPGIIVTPSATVPRQYKILATHNDVSTWQQISGRLPRWCFIFLSGDLTSNGQHFVGYPQILWQGKPYYFGRQ